MKTAQLIGLVLFLLAFGIFNGSMFSSQHKLDEKTMQSIYKAANGEIQEQGNKYHATAIEKAAKELGVWEKEYSTNLAFVSAFKESFEKAEQDLKTSCGIDETKGVWNCVAEKLPDGVDEWTYRMGPWMYKDYAFKVTRSSTRAGLIPSNPWLFFFLSFVLASLGGLIYFLPLAQGLAGIKHNGIYHNKATKGLSYGARVAFFAVIGLAVLGLGFTGKHYMSLGKEFNFILVLASTMVAGLIFFLIWWSMRKWKGSSRSASVQNTGWISVAMGLYLIGFYIVLYFYPEYMTNWIMLVDPISLSISGNPASQWFLYGFLYCLVMLVMGVRMYLKYRHNRYQQIRTTSVLFFQLAFAFFIPELLARFNNPYMDFKTPWPLDYTFFYDYRLDSYLQADGNSILGIQVGTMMFVWGIILMAIIVPLFTYLYGKRWYCSWVCGCGGLAETLGDPFRQQSDKSLKAWKAERYIIYGVLALATFMSALLVIAYLDPTVKQSDYRVLGVFNLGELKTWYGFLISSAFAGVVGTGFYPIMGNRVWCRFGCPLAALMGIVQRFKSRFRITTNGSQCISCGNCSTYCEMGIDVRWYAQRGQDIVRASCVGCGVCSAVCPRGVLRLENGSADVSERASEERVLHISKEDGVKLM